jgi:nitric oxide dioxygenase
MTPTQIDAVQQHFMTVFPIKAQVSEAFYQRLFEIAPDVRGLFPQDMRVQREKIADTLALVVKNLNNTEHLLISLQGLARRHRGYGAEPAHCGPVGEALLFSIDAAGPEPITNAQRAAWSVAYEMIAEAMAGVIDQDAA